MKHLRIKRLQAEILSGMSQNEAEISPILQRCSGNGNSSISTFCSGNGNSSISTFLIKYYCTIVLLLCTQNLNNFTKLEGLYLKITVAADDNG
jgi:hypothetical protein